MPGHCSGRECPGAGTWRVCRPWEVVLRENKGDLAFHDDIWAPSNKHLWKSGAGREWFLIRRSVELFNLSENVFVSLQDLACSAQSRN